MLFRSDEDEAAASAPDFVRVLLAAHGPDADAPVIRRQVYTFHARIADRWNSRCIFLAGDAAHLSPPFAGQGMNSGVRDAHNLAWKLAAVATGRLGPALLDSYRRERAPHAQALINLAVNMGRVMMPTSRAEAFLVQGAFRLARFAPRLQAYFAQMKYKPKPFYRDGFVVADDGGLRLAGRMLPQPLVELPDRRRLMLDDLLGDGFVLIAYGREAQRVIADSADLDLGLGALRRLAVLPSDCNPDPAFAQVTVVRDVDGLLASGMPDAGVALLLRPDRYVAAAARTEPDAVARMAERMRAMVQET